MTTLESSESELSPATKSPPRPSPGAIHTCAWEREGEGEAGREVGAGRAGGGGWLGGLAILVATEETIQICRGIVAFRFSVGRGVF